MCFLVFLFGVLVVWKMVVFIGDVICVFDLYKRCIVRRLVIIGVCLKYKVSLCLVVIF